jgi:hypothetical protein
MPKKSLVIDVHHHWMPDEHYRRPELHIPQDEEVIHEADRFRIRRAGGPAVLAAADDRADGRTIESNGPGGGRSGGASRRRRLA